ncbi:hypothetical protein pb186bvf_000563 [Paramecium bursaria]
MRCKTQESYDSFKCPLNSPKSQPFRIHHKSSRSEDIDLLQFNVQDNIISEMNYSSVHEVSLSSARNTEQKNEIIKKQEEIIKRQEQQISVLKSMLMSQSKQDIEQQFRQLNQFAQKVFQEVGMANKENIPNSNDLEQALSKLQGQKLKLKEQNKFVQCLRDLILNCSPPNYFPDNRPNLKQIWRSIKIMLNECVEFKKCYEEQQGMVVQIQKIFKLNSPKQIVPYLLINFQ